MHDINFDEWSCYVHELTIIAGNIIYLKQNVRNINNLYQFGINQRTI
jgi:hypothetical protein